MGGMEEKMDKIEKDISRIGGAGAAKRNSFMGNKSFARKSSIQQALSAAQGALNSSETSGTSASRRVATSVVDWDRVAHTHTHTYTHTHTHTHTHRTRTRKGWANIFLHVSQYMHDSSQQAHLLLPSTLALRAAAHWIVGN